MKRGIGLSILILGGVGAGWLGKKYFSNLSAPFFPEVTESLSLKPGSTESKKSGADQPEAQLAFSGSPGNPSPSPDAASPERRLGPEDQRKLRVLEEVFASRNDNDPRIDTELKEFSPAAKEALRERYSATVPEKRNERGTLVFLLGREISDVRDLEFFSKVLAENCLSLQDCRRPPEAHSGAEDHFESINETTTHYPQLQALGALRRRAEELAGEEPPSPLLRGILTTLEGASGSPNPRVAGDAQRILIELRHENRN